MPKTDVRESLLDACERLLIEKGRDGITTRRVAREAGVNHGLVHYYYGSVESLLLAVLDRFGRRLIARQRLIYDADMPFVDRWRTSMAYVEEDLAAGYPKIWHELQALAWNHPQLRDRVAGINREWRGVLTESFTEAAGEYGLSPRAVEPIVALAMTFSQGLLSERLIGVGDGHAELLAWIDALLRSLEAEGRHSQDGAGEEPAGAEQ
jgi:TetR/AcrR family transcriptional regulator